MAGRGGSLKDGEGIPRGQGVLDSLFRLTVSTRWTREQHLLILLQGICSILTLLGLSEDCAFPEGPLFLPTHTLSEEVMDTRLTSWLVLQRNVMLAIRIVWEPVDFIQTNVVWSNKSP